MIPCPTCAAGLRFDIASQKMVCDYCKNSFDPASLSDNSATDDAKTEKYFDGYIYICPSCGAEIITTDKNDAVGFCQYCGGASMIFDKIRKEWRPDVIAPFKVTKEQCKELYLKEIRKNPFIGGKYRNPQTIDGFRGIYMPYWSYHAELSGPFRVRAVSGREHVGGNIYHIYHFDIDGVSDYRINGYSHDASVSFDDDLSEGIAPFDSSGQVRFIPAYLSGFYAETGDTDPQHYNDDITGEIVEDAQKLYKNDPAVTKVLSDRRLNLSESESALPARIKSVSRAMNPVWFMSCRGKKDITYAAVNGQTGKVAADLPLSPVRILIAALGISAVIFGLIFGAMSFLPSIKANMTLALCTLLAVTGMYFMQRSFNYTVDKNMSVLGKSKTGVLCGGLHKFATVITFLSIFAIAVDGSYKGDIRFLGQIGALVGSIIIVIACAAQFSDSRKIQKMKINQMSQLRVRITEEARWFSKSVLWLKIVMIASIAVSLALVLLDPANNAVSYGACFLLAAELFGLAIYHISFQTRVAKRPLPQFKKEGAYYDRQQ